MFTHGRNVFTELIEQNVFTELIEQNVFTELIEQNVFTELIEQNVFTELIEQQQPYRDFVSWNVVYTLKPRFRSGRPG